MKRAVLLRLFRIPALFMACGYCIAAHEEHPDHEHLQQVENLDFRQILQHALEQAPESLELESRSQQAASFVAAGRSWVSDVPQLYMSVIDDRIRSDLGQAEQEVGVHLPLRRPGELRSAREHGDNYVQLSVAFDSMLQWQLAGALRTVLADIEAAQVLLGLEHQATAIAEQLLDVTEKLHAAGAVARIDVLQSENLLLLQQQQSLNAEAALVDAEREYIVLTGLQQAPAGPHREGLSELEDVPDLHPALAYLQQSVSLADSEIRQNEYAAKGSPQLSIGSRRERGNQTQPYLDSIGLSLSVPIGGKSIVDARTSTARREKTDREVELRNARRTLQMQLHEAEHELYVTRQSLPLARRQSELGSQSREMAQNAYAEGETTLTQVLLAVQAAVDAEKTLFRLQLQEQRLISEYNQIIGEMP